MVHITKPFLPPFFFFFVVEANIPDTLY